MRIKHNYVCIIYPSDYNEAENKISDITEKYNMNEETSEKEVIQKIFNIFKEISTESPFVSTYCDLTRVAIEREGVKKYHAEDEVDNFLSSIKDQSIMSKFKEI